MKERGYLFVTSSPVKNSNQIVVTELISNFLKPRHNQLPCIVKKGSAANLNKCFFAKLNKKWNIILFGKECAGQLNKERSLFIAPRKFESTGKT